MFHRISLPIRLSMLASKNSTPGKSVKCRARATDLVHRGLIWGPHPVTAGGHLAPIRHLESLSSSNHITQIRPAPRLSAMSPARSELSGKEMIAWLANCLKAAITAKPEKAVIVTKQLLTNVRTVAIPEEDFPVICADFEHFSTARIDDLLWTLFGIFVDPSQKAECQIGRASCRERG